MSALLKPGATPTIFVKMPPAKSATSQAIHGTLSQVQKRRAYCQEISGKLHLW